MIMKGLMMKYTEAHKKWNSCPLLPSILYNNVHYKILCFFGHINSSFETFCGRIQNLIYIMFMFVNSVCIDSSFINCSVASLTFMFVCSINTVLNIGAASELTSHYFFLVVEKTFWAVERTLVFSISYFKLWCVICFTLPFCAEYSFMYTFFPLQSLLQFVSTYFGMSALSGHPYYSQ